MENIALEMGVVSTANIKISSDDVFCVHILFPSYTFTFI